MERRRFLQRGLWWVFSAIGFLILGYPVYSFITFRKTRKRAIFFGQGELTGSVYFKNGVFLVKQEDHIYALSAQCPHLGCTLNYDVVSRRFQCPCHGSIFSLSGGWVTGPAKKDMRMIPVAKRPNGDFVVVLER